jgi:hypothetical protein
LQPAALIVMGIVSYFMVWLWHDSGRVGNVAWTRVPTRLRQFLRFRPGPVYLSAVAVQLWALLMLVAALVAQVFALDTALRRVVLEGPFYLIIAVVALWAALAGLATQRRR